MDILANIVNAVNLTVAALFLLFYGYQFIYTVIALLKKKTYPKDVPIHDIAVLISARNEEMVIGNLLCSLEKQDYPKDHYRVFVCADNCTDRTADIVREHGVTVYERRANTELAKGYALEFLLDALDRDFGKEAFDAYIVFDADNLASRSFITEMNRAYSAGYEIVAGYRNAKNYGASWVAAGSGHWFIRDSRFMNGARSVLGVGAVVAGTGFLFSRKVKEHHGGWPFHCLVEDTEFMVASALAGYAAGYAPDAEFFDEQPTRFGDSLRQRIRWARGGLQVLRMYGKRLLRGLFTKNAPSCLDFLVSFMPAYIIMMAALVTNLVGVPILIFAGKFSLVAPVLIGFLLGLMLFVLFFSYLTTFVEWRRIRTTAGKKLLYGFTFVFFMLSYLIVALVAMLVKVKWTPIRHTDTTRMEEL